MVQRREQQLVRRTPTVPPRRKDELSSALVRQQVAEARRTRSGRLSPLREPPLGQPLGQPLELRHKLAKSPPAQTSVHSSVQRAGCTPTLRHPARREARERQVPRCRALPVQLEQIKFKGERWRTSRNSVCRRTEVHRGGGKDHPHHHHHHYHRLPMKAPPRWNSCAFRNDAGGLSKNSAAAANVFDGGAFGTPADSTGCTLLPHPALSPPTRAVHTGCTQAHTRTPTPGMPGAGRVCSVSSSSDGRTVFFHSFSASLSCYYFAFTPNDDVRAPGVAYHRRPLYARMGTGHTRWLIGGGFLALGFRRILLAW
uniref:Uncharacterized protein n=1 Tax=Anopheles farauti TaxID=69004 RepID=A0A182QFG4_9DIPT